MKTYLLTPIIVLSMGLALAQEPSVSSVSTDPPAIKYKIDTSKLGDFTEVHESKPFKEGGKIFVENIAGHITLIGWDRKEIEVHAHLGENVERLQFDINKKSAHISVIVPSRTKKNSKILSELVIFVPKLCGPTIDSVTAQVDLSHIDGKRWDGIDIDTVEGNVVLDDITGDVWVITVSGDVGVKGGDTEVVVDTVNGDISIHGDSEEVAAESVNGNIHIQGKSREIEVDTVSGNINIVGNHPDVWLATVSGKITVDSQELSEADIESLSGPVLILGNLHKQAEVYIETFSGDVDFILDTPFYGEYYLESFSGKAQINIKDKQYGPSKELEIDHFDGKGEIYVETFSGNVKISDKE